MPPRLLVLVFAVTAFCPLPAGAADSDIRVSSIGYLPARVKRASIAAAATQWTLVRDADGGTASSGTLSAAKTDVDTGQSPSLGGRRCPAPVESAPRAGMTARANWSSQTSQFGSCRIGIS